MFNLKKQQFKVGLLVFALSGFVFSSEVKAEDLKVAVLDSNRLIEASLPYKSITSQLDAKQKSVKEELQKEEGKLKKKYQELETQKNVLSKEVFESKSDEIVREAEKLQKISYTERAMLDRAFSGAMKKLSDKLNELVAKEAKGHEYDVVIERATLSYFKPSLDVTDGVLKQLNDALPEVKVHFSHTDNAKVQ
jgi:outer membrane protein